MPRLFLCRGDGSGAAQSVDRIAAGWRLRQGLARNRRPASGVKGYSRGQLAESDLQAAQHDLGHMFAEALAIGAL